MSKKPKRGTSGVSLSSLENNSRSAPPIEVIAVVGPTASGKSAVADVLAHRLGSSVVSADAMQVYRGMDIGTAKTPLQERRVPLLCVDLVDPGEAYSVARFAQDAHAAIDALVAQGQTPIVCGGTGLYVRAALEDMDFPAGEQVENPIRKHYEQLASELGNDAFHSLLSERDPESAALIHPNNVRRVVRAFELLEQGSSYAKEHETLYRRTDRRPTLMVGLTLPRELLYERINRRVDQMLELGLMDEVQHLVENGLADTLTARQAIGYKELLSVLDGTDTFDHAVESIKQATRRYAKRQMTWFKADPRVHWLEAEGQTPEQLADAIMELLPAGI